MTRLPPQCQRQIGYRPTFLYNAISIPVARICPHFALEGSNYCERHQDPGETP